MGPQARMAAGKATGVSAEPAQSVGPFVINLCSSTTPMALSHPDSPEMKRFSFFVSRRREDNRERFRLHMGYFSTLAEAEEWLNVVRDIYPGAWAGEAPGKKLRARAAAAALANDLPPPPTAPPAASRVVSVTPKPAAAAPVVARQAIPSPTNLIVPTLQAAPAAVAPSAGATGTFRAIPDPASSTSIHPAPAAISATGMHRALGTSEATGTHRAINSSSGASASATGMHRALSNADAAGAQRAAQSASSTGMHRALANPSATGTHKALVNPSFTGTHKALVNPSATGTHKALVNPSATGTHKALANPSATGTHRALVNPEATGSHRALTNASATGTHRALTQPAAAPVQTRPVTTPVAAATARPAQPQRAAGQPVARGAAPAPKQPAAAQVARTPAKGVPKKSPGVPPALSGSNVREVMAALDETGETRQMRAPTFNASAASAPSARASTPPASAAPGAPGRTKAPVSRPQQPATQAEAPALTDTQVLRFLEQRRDDSSGRVEEGANSGISLLKPDDTQTRLALKDAVRDNAPVSFAVQLHWSVSPIELDKVPPLAIFSAYTLYTVEGSREGRKWYGLRLGFFSDAISAKQVATYVRSEFTTVAVVPVSPQEKVRAGAEETRAATGRLAKPRIPEPRVDEFKLFDDVKSAAAPVAAPAAPAAAEKPKAAAPRKNKPLGKVRAKEQKSAKTLEETLEILGASDLEIDNGRGEVLNDTGVRHLRVEVQKNTPFAKLLDRLSEKVRRN